MLKRLRSKSYYKFGGIFSWILIPIALYCRIYSLLPNGFGSLGAGLCSFILFAALTIIYILLLIISIFDNKRIVNNSTNLFIDIGYIVGFVSILYFISTLKLS